MALLKPIFTYEISLCRSLKQSIHSESVPKFLLRFLYVYRCILHISWTIVLRGADSTIAPFLNMEMRMLICVIRRF